MKWLPQRVGVWRLIPRGEIEREGANLSLELFRLVACKSLLLVVLSTAGKLSWANGGEKFALALTGWDNHQKAGAT